ncbi:MAG: efflux RND transporter periplasmic adaptor subunit [Thermodesulfobacteriota bacterium]
MYLYNNRINLNMTMVLFLATVILVMPFGVLAAEKKQAPPSTPVHTALVREALVSRQVSVIGTTEAFRRSTVAAEVSGRVEALHVREGDFVKKGTPLVNLGSTDIELRLKGAVAGREAIKARLILAKKELERVKNLKTTNSIAAKQYDEAYFSAMSLTRELERNNAELERIRYELDRKTVPAPFAGFIVHEHTQVGQWIPVGGSIVTLVDLSSILVKADLPEADAVQLNPDNGVSVVINSLSSRPLSASIEAVMPQGNPVSRTFPVHLKIPNEKYSIKSGMEAIATFELGRKIKSILVPKDAIVPAGTDNLVFRVDQGKAFPVSVAISGYYGNEAAVKGELEPGQKVVVRGNERLRPGQSVHGVD